MYRITVHATERVVEYRDGAFTRVLEPGRHRYPRRARHQRVDIREQLTSLAPQEVLTADGLTVRATAVARWRVVDPRTFLESTDNPVAVLYLAVQVALRDALATTEAEAAARRGGEGIDVQLRAAAERVAADIGVQVVEVVVKDVILPAAVRDAHADLVSARTRGAAQLEAARAETAALRSLANGARLLDEHPALARLRLVQALPAGATVEVALPG